MTFPFWRVVLAAVLASSASTASALSYFGTLSNFDVLNDTGGETEGFEIELHGVGHGHVTYTFGGSYSRYGTPQVESFAGGVYVRYRSAYDDTLARFVTHTPMAQNFTPSGHDCYQGGPVGNYLSSGCEHFGVGLSQNATEVRYRWLKADPNTPGHLVASGTDVPIPAPRWVVQEPQQPGNPVVVLAEVDAPEIEPADPRKYGDALWAKVVKTKVERPLALEELLSDGDVFDPAEVETEIDWKLLQSREGRPDEGGLDIENPVAGERKSISYRYEFYRFTGTLSDDGEAQCLVDGCNAPGDGELGPYIGAQMAALNLAPVPEPGTYATLGAGLALLGGWVRRGRRR